MVLSIYFLSLISFIMGWIYYYKPQSVQKINGYFKNIIFNDRNVLLKRKKIAVVFLLLSAFFFTSGFLISQNEKNRKPLPVPVETIDKEIIFDIISIYMKRLDENPEDLATLKKLACAYDTIGEKKREFIIWKRILTLYPEDETAKKRLQLKH